MPAFKDLTGQKFGKLTAICPVRGNGNIKYLCSCDCSPEKTKLIAAHALSQGLTRSCGCLIKIACKARSKNLIINRLGQTFGKLLVIGREDEPNTPGTIWICKCECLNVVRVKSSLLPRKKSCGCLRGYNPSRTYKDLTGMIFDRLTVLEFHERINGRIYWKCLCDCPLEKTKIVCGGNLISKHVRSCGCVGEEYKNLRGKNHYNYNPEISEEDRATNRHYCEEDQQWKKLVKERDNWTCQISGEKARIVEAHHIFNFADFPELRRNLENGITLSQNIHKLFHKLYGRKFNTSERFQEFSTRFFAGEWRDYQI